MDERDHHGLGDARPTERPRSRRAVLAGLLGGVGAWAAASVGRAGPVAAANGDVVHVGDQGLTGTQTTVISTATPSISVLWGSTTANTGSGVGLRGDSASQGGSGVWGNNTGFGPGVSGTSSGTGVSGTSSSAFGVHGRSGAGVAVIGAAGVLGESSASRGVWGVSNSSFGVAGTSSTGTGVVGDSSSGTGVAGYSGAVNGVGVRGEAPFGRGVEARSTSARAVDARSESGWGVYGRSDTSHGVHGSGQGSVGVGVYGESSAGQGVHGTSTSGIGAGGVSRAVDRPAVFGHSQGDSTGMLAFSAGLGSTLPAAKPKTGLYAEATQDGTSRGVWGRSNRGQGVRGQATGGVGVYATATTGFALRTSGRLKVDKVSGVASIPAGATSVTVSPGVDVTDSSFVLLTPMVNLGGRDLWVSLDPSADTVTIRISTQRGSVTKVAWLLLG